MSPFLLIHPDLRISVIQRLCALCSLMGVSESLGMGVDEETGSVLSVPLHNFSEMKG